MSAIYLDYNASGLVRPEVQAIMAAALADNGNPNAVHAAGRRARARIETARAHVAALVGVDPTAVVFSSGGTESNGQALVSALAAGCERLIVSATEHPCVSETALTFGHPVECLPVDDQGVIDLVWLAEALQRPGRAVVAVHHANNETGVVQPVAEAARLVHAAGGWMHVDAIQSAGKIPVDMAALEADTLTLSGHKLGGPQGVGALISREGLPVVRMVHGSSQERGLRAGTENTPGIAGFGESAVCALRDLPECLSHAVWRDDAAAAVTAAGATVLGEKAERLPNTLFMAVPDWDSPQQLITLDLQGVMVSAGSACSSGKTKPSKAVSAMGLHHLETGGVRVSGGWGTTRADWIRFADLWVSAYARHCARATERAKETA
ncbi:cysteine desulfurase family protein [uncultured Brevundimonas sp.]|uniref:cysteine desulfurase family protein n=1 Tax=uncultured Brevundimonas sp. TaxID=213418 RepID=UPI0030ED7C8D